MPIQNDNHTLQKIEGFCTIADTSSKVESKILNKV